MIWILRFLICATSMYMVIAFVTLDFNPMTWSMWSRAWWLIGSYIVGMMWWKMLIDLEEIRRRYGNH